MSAMIEATDLTMRFGAVEALRGLTISIERGELFALLGPDGAGKTTFFRLVAGLVTPSGGRVQVSGVRTFGLVPQRFSLYEDLTIDENLHLRARLYDVPDALAKTRTADLLARVGLERFRTRLAGALSGGMKQKLALVSALLTQPELLLLDEPTTGVDPVSRREFWILLNQLHHEGLTLLVSTPYMDEAEYASRLAFLDRGRVTAIGTREAIVGDVSASAGRGAQPRPHATAATARGAARRGRRLAVRHAPARPRPHRRRAGTAVGGAPGAGRRRRRRRRARDCAVTRGRLRLAQRAAGTRSGGSGMTAPAPDVLVSARQLTRRFGNFVAVRNIDVEIPRGRVFGFLGPNGSGKSTTIRMLAGLLAPSSGTITGFGGIDLATNTDAWKRRLGYMSQKFSLYLDLTVEENLRFFGSVYGLRGASLLDRIDALADRLRFQDGAARSSPKDCRPGCGSASRSPRRCCTNRNCSSSTSRRAESTRSGVACSGISSTSSPRIAA